ncbi:MAG: MlaD family protein [Victivallales bacterium]
MIEANKYKLGLFVISGISLLVIVLFLLGIADIFKPKVQFVTLFDESVQGLEPGAPVKFRGVTIGKVSNVTVRPSDNLVRVDMEAELSAIDAAGGQEKLSVITRKAEFFYKMEKEVEKGLRCRLDLMGITGLKYVEMNYFDPEKYPVPDAIPPKGVRYIPSTPSFLRGLSSNITTALARIANVNFDEIATELVSSLKAIKSVLNDPRVTSVIQKIDNISGQLEITSANINKVMTESSMKDIYDEIKMGASSINELSRTLQKQVEEAKIAETTASARGTMDDAKQAVKSFNDVSTELSDTLKKLDEALDSFTELVNNLDEDPSSVFRGKQKRQAEF